MDAKHRMMYLRSAPRHQRGSIALFAALGIGVMIIMLSVLDIGFLYYYKREYQKAADLAALSGSAQLEAGCEAAQNAATQRAMDNLVGLRYDAITPQTGTWSRRDRFQPDPDCELQANAMRVVISGTPPRFLIRGDRAITASAVSTDGDPVASFSVGTRLASLGGSSVVGNVLRGVGIDLGLNLLDYDDGLADIGITPGGLLEALGLPVSADIGVAQFNSLLAAESVRLGDLLDATVVAAGQEHLLGLNAALLNALRVPLNVLNPDDIILQLGSDEYGSGLFATVSATPATALEASVSALDLVATAIAVAASNRAIDVDLSGLSGLGILGLNNLTVQSGIVEPPSIGIGGVGTRAYSAQTRIYAHVELSTNDILGPVGGLLGGLLGTTVSIDLPLVIDVASAAGTLEELCTPSLRQYNAPPDCLGDEDCGDITVDAQVAKICVGNVDPDTLFSNAASCDEQLSNQTLLSANLLGAGLLSLNTSLGIDAVGSGGYTILAEQRSATIGNNLALGSTVHDLTDALLAALLATGVDGAPSLSLSQRQQLAAELWDEVNGNSCGSGSAGRICRRDRIVEANALIDDSVSGLSGFLADALLNPVIGLLDAALSLNLLAILASVGSLLGGLLGAVGDLLGAVIGLLLGNPCTGGGLLPPYNGTNQGCVNELTSAMNTTSGGSPQAGNALLLGLLLDALAPLLDAIGNQLLTPLLESTLGLNVGETDVRMLGLECREGSVLVD